MAHRWRTRISRSAAFCIVLAFSCLLATPLEARRHDAGLKRKPPETTAAPTTEVAPEQARTVPKTAEERSLPPEVPPPHFARFKHQQPELLLKEKREGRYLIPIPQVGVDPDIGFVLGAALTLYDNGTKESPFFRIAPYRQMIEIQGVASTGGLIQFEVDYDQPYIFDTPWRVRGELEILTNPSMNYFGIGDDSLTLTYPGSARSYGSYDDYKNALRQEVNGATYARYDEYGYSRTGIRGSAEYDLVGGLLRPLIGFQLQHVWITDYTGDTVKARNATGQSVNALELPTHLENDCRSGRAIGCKGGYDIYIKLGLTFDTRDFEPDPSTGLLFQVTSELSPTFLGSAYNYGRLATSLSAYGKLLQWRQQRLVLAGRVFYQWQFGDVPFYSMNTLAFNTKDQTGLGGFDSLRGFKSDRFVGPVAMMTNMELRWSFVDFTLFNQNLRLGLAPFFDAGRVFDRVSETTFRDWKVTGGMGLRLAWNLSTVVCFDYGFSSEQQAFYMQVDLPF